MAKGFGQAQPSKLEKLVEYAAGYCQQRSPENLDGIFDNVPSSVSQQVMIGALAALEKDIDSQGWFCGYIASEINRTEDNQKPYHPIAGLSKTLIALGMKPFADFLPYPGCRILVLNSKKFQELPEKIRDMVQQAFEVVERSPEEAHQINNALMQELNVL
ncbi:hypothetical protein VF14_02920 [Nostoc linckia z18]|uniref:Uncharacterized protein n=2 Tax=Nostoc linckia TaxID=92942 RepID=A0A9Q5ZGU5_NOSLI|nr:hypothetical protein [Nostoc linckia]PHK39166.1 hypothetical protein VF12_15200 [Nostoc linckia z15]PHK46778.1 hypothetical protein VF13_08805 [Nostoc linckia z16]PHJ69107.1 hypothetical protein VF02_00390 [Nostoc linckia z1]PHJ73258.1 hypothetical protein VF05_01405 [Nostoc linckia z3]PHJ78605.1 hypothetical protein VF03_00390 [Nostoc linckia z2]